MKLLKETEFRYLFNCCNVNFKRNGIKDVDKYYTHHPTVQKFCSFRNRAKNSKNAFLAIIIICNPDFF